ncbi:KAP family P-loop domain-containing protein [Flexibacter flexilis DSM 6793]|uniref:KAP family P-loop domain-containing protein n=1 Tax=Flexibacter flexilis DSM 6793 TaxID=927664 RepID=A0A1I1NML6_9BACT|nr:P-loop NTPase fold protein [Flexibacter flexilis]SFC98889.1 KAP family P-loop domain-containing protein [Flexibacter flexilis DSM 6793]
MSIRIENLWDDNGNPFGKCKLEREPYAEVLTSLVENYPSGFVLAINNKWGTGKTTFVQMWKRYLKEKAFQTVYFNAWENDFEDNPLVAIIGELKASLGNEDSEGFEKLIDAAATFSKSIIPALLKGAIKNYIDTEVVVEAISQGSKGLIEIFDKEVNEYATKKQNIQAFKNNLTELLQQKTPEKPLVFIIDELDRCRPNYAVSVLEQVKHLFSVPNIVFVLSIDKQQLGHAICGVYGSANIDTTEYLRRFIDIEYSLPEPNNEKFFNYLYQYYGLDSFLQSISSDEIELKNVLRLLLTNATLRQQEKILSYTRIAVRTLGYNTQLDLRIIAFLIYVKFLQEDFYNDLKRHIPIDKMHQQFIDILQGYTFSNDENEIVAWLECLLLKYYSYNWGRAKGHELLLKQPVEKLSDVKVRILLKYSSEQQMIDTIQRFSRLSLDDFIKKVDMLDNFLV